MAEVETDREREKRLVKEIIEQSDATGLQPGEVYCLIYINWWTSWQRYVQYNQSYAYSLTAERPGPIDNSNLLDAAGDLKVEVSERYHFIFIPKAAWDLLFSWYQGGPLIDRVCIKSWNQTTIELRKLKLSVIWSRQPKNIVIRSFSKSTPVETFLEEMRKEMKWNRKNIRLIDFYQARRTSTIARERWNKSLEECQIMDKQYVLIEERKKDGTWPNDNIYKHLQTTNSHSYYSAPAPPSPPGQTGLNNLGNTCFMNSALQCLSAAVPLTDYFLTEKYVPDINSTNPLGMKGEMAREYRAFLGELWSSATGTHAPRNMKSKIERYAPQFGGYAQHDSQELLAFLLDGLHEDLNRVIKKPTVETQDTWTPQQFWEGHKSRNDSIVVDLFQGQLQSRLRCPNNGRVSTVYDPFMYLSVPLPVDNKRKLLITVYRLDPSILPLKIGIIVDKDGTVADIKKSVSAVVNIPATNLALVDVGRATFFKEWQDNEDVSDVRENDIIAAHEIIPKAPKREHVVELTDDKENKSSSSSEEPESEIVRIILYQEMLHKNHSSTMFGTPLILSVPTDITYRQLYCRVVKHLSAGAPEGATSGGIFKKIPSLNIYTDPPPDDAPESDPGSFSDNTVFEFKYVPSPGQYTKLGRCVNNDFPLRLPDRRIVQLVWQTKLYKTFIDEEKCDNPPIEIHESCKGSLQKKEKVAIPLVDCIRLFNEEEQLSQNDSWYCSECKDHVQAFKKFAIWTAPPLLVIHLKRFSYRGRAFRERLDHLVDFPLKDLDLSEFVEGQPGVEHKYDLFAVSNHYGNLGGGHYTAYAKSRNDDTWFSFDDSSVSVVRDPESKVVSTASYVLFYKRKNVPWTPFDEALDQAIAKEKKKEDAPKESSDQSDDSDEYEPESGEEKDDKKEGAGVEGAKDGEGVKPSDGQQSTAVATATTSVTETNTDQVKVDGQ